MNKNISGFWIYGVVLASAFGVFLPVAWAEENPREIMKRVIDRDDGATQVVRQKIATCRYTLKNKKTVCAEDPRIKISLSVQKDVGKGGKDSRTVMILRDPPGEKGVGFLQFDYDDPQKSTDQWMYLPALGKVRRLVSGNDNEPKTGSLFGSEFSYEDLERRHLDDSTYRILKSDTYNGRPTWVMESIPTPEYARKSSYSRSINWVDKERFMVLKVLLYDRQRKPFKQLTFKNVEKLSGIWMARSININNVKSRRVSTLKMEKIALNITVPPGFLSMRTLTDGAFREGHLQNLLGKVK